MLVLAILIACGGGDPAAPDPGAAVGTPEAPKRLNVAREDVDISLGARRVPLDILLTGDPTLFGTYVDAGEVWVDESLGGMIIDEAGKVVAKADITQQVRSVGLRGLGSAHVVEEKPDPNSEGVILKKVRAVGKYAGCEAGLGGTGATVCWVDVGDPPPSTRVERSEKDRFSPGVTSLPGFKSSIPAPVTSPAPTPPAPAPK